jgi:hypothetical protein
MPLGDGWCLLVRACCGFLGLGGFSFWVLSSVEKNFGCSWGVFCSYYQARRGLDVLPAHATRVGRDGVTSDWLCMWRVGALDPGINIVVSLCAGVRFFGLA